MLKKILQTIGVRYLVAFLNLALILINTKVLGVEGVGLVGILIASINIVVVVCSVLCGNTIVYFINRFPVYIVLMPAYAWAIVASLLTSLLLVASEMIPVGYEVDIFLLALLNAAVAINSRYLLAKDYIKLFNLCFFLQGGTLFFFTPYFFFFLEQRNVQAYVYAYYLSNSLAFLVSMGCVVYYLRLSGKANTIVRPPFWSTLKEMFTYGLWSGMDNLAENLSTRLNYFLLQHFSGVGSVGLLDTGTRISESVFHISRSISFITYGEVARMDEAKKQQQIALRLFKVTFFALILVMAVILLLPEWVYTEYLFSAEFVGIKSVIAALSIGIVALGSNSILSHYFIGTGRVKTSVVCSFIGLGVLLLTGLCLVPRYAALGASLSASVAFSSMLAYSLCRFASIAKASFGDFFPCKEDYLYIRRLIVKK